MTQAERIIALEVKVEELKQQFERHQHETQKEFIAINGKLDDLLALRNKGAGVFWLASTLLGAGIVGVVVQFLDWFKAIGS
jgi:hypothetical protein